MYLSREVSLIMLVLCGGPVLRIYLESSRRSKNELLSGYFQKRTTTMETMSTLEGCRTSPLSLDSSSLT